MTTFKNDSLISRYLDSGYDSFRDFLFDIFRSRFSNDDGTTDEQISFSDNVIGNNAAILLTDNAQSTVNFLYVNPIEFFNAGRASDIYLNFPPSTGSIAQTAGSDVQTNDDETETSGGITGNVVSNNAAILLTDDAQSTVNFLYINPIEFFNGGRASDIYINAANADSETALATTTDEDAAGEDAFGFLDDIDPAEAAELAAGILQEINLPETPDLMDALGIDDEFSFNNSEPTEIIDALTDDIGEGGGINDNLIGNNGAIIMTDNAQSTVNFLYINPIEFFNDGRGSDIYLNVTAADGATTTTALGADNVSGDAAIETASEDDVGFLEELDVSEALELAVDVLEEISIPEPLSLLDALGVSDAFTFEDTDAVDIIDSLTDGAGDGMEINDNVIGNNAAILLTDDAQSTVNFLYINPIQFFNDGRAGDIHINITLSDDDGLFLL